MSSKLPTRFAPAERADAEVVDRQAERLKDLRLLDQLGGAIPSVLMILNKHRQIVYANERLAEMLNMPNWEQVKGRRPGEVLGCVHSGESPGGCGTTEFCRKCGAVNAILESQNGAQSVKECRILTNDGGALDLRVWATPYERDGEQLTVFSVLDIGSEKRRLSLERTFFHDVLNTAGGLSGLSSLLQEEEDPEEAKDLAKMVHHASERLTEEIQSQRTILAAERGQLEIARSGVSSLSLLHDVVEVYSGHEAASDRSITILGHSDDVEFVTDPVLLRRVVGNMLKNALEATPPGENVSLSCSSDQDTVTFSVHNPTPMPRDVQLQIFKRSYSTKGSGRGIGTYSMKLFAERYLGGEVRFTVSEEEGTTFCVILSRGVETASDGHPGPGTGAGTA